MIAGWLEHMPLRKTMCSISGCDKDSVRNNKCSMHYMMELVPFMRSKRRKKLKNALSDPKYALAKKSGEFKNGEANINSKLTESQVVKIYSSEKRTGDIASQYNISREYVWKIKNKKVWKSVLDEL